MFDNSSLYGGVDCGRGEIKLHQIFSALLTLLLVTNLANKK